jgi:hypothetical protein
MNEIPIPAHPFAPHSLTHLFTHSLTHSLNIYSHSTSPTLVPSTSPPTTSTPRISRSLSSNTEIITTIAGTGTVSYSGDNGQATDAGLYLPHGVALDAAGE